LFLRLNQLKKLQNYNIFTTEGEIAIYLFQGTPQDIYIHWLILSLGVGILLSGIAVITTCRSIAGFFHLLQGKDTFKTRLYKAYFKFHSFYWVAFFLLLILHLLVTIPHIGIPSPGEAYALAHWVAFYSSIANFLLVLVVFASCRSFISLYNLFSSGSPLKGGFFKRFYNWHALIWVLLLASVIIHIVSGIVHAVNT
jgi:hypothetical protein